MYPFKVCSSMVSRIFMELYIQYHNQFQNIFITPKKNSALLSHNPPHSLTLIQEAINLLSVCINLPAIALLYERIM